MQRTFGATIAAMSLICMLAGPSSGQLLTQDRHATDAVGVAARDNTPVPSVTMIGSSQAEGVLGKQVRSAADEDMGRIVDVVVDRSGRVRAAVIDFGGFFGVGSRKIAVDWNALSFTSDGDGRDAVTLGLTREQVKAAPEYKDKRPVMVLGAADPAPAYPGE